MMENIVQGDNVSAVLDRALDAGEGLLRLSPNWVPRSFLHPAKRIKLHADHYYAYGAERGGIDERWFAIATDAANEGQVWHGIQDFALFEGQHFMLKGAGSEAGGRLLGQAMSDKYQRRPVYSKFFDNMGPLAHHMHRTFEDAKLVGHEGQPETPFSPQSKSLDVVPGGDDPRGFLVSDRGYRNGCGQTEVLIGACREALSSLFRHPLALGAVATFTPPTRRRQTSAGSLSHVSACRVSELRKYRLSTRC